MYQKIVDTCGVIALVVIAITLTLLTFAFFSDSMYISVMSMGNLYKHTSALSQNAVPTTSESPPREILFQDELFQLIRNLSPAEFEEFSTLKGNERADFLKQRGYVIPEETRATHP